MLRIIILVIAVAAGGLAGWLALSSQSSSPPSVVIAAQQEPTEEILVASVDLPLGQTLSKENVRWQLWPKSAMNPGFINRSAMPEAITSLEGTFVRNQLLSGEPIREEKLSRRSAGFLAINLPAGKRAVAIRVTAESTAGGFILPNDRVDVIQTVVGGSGRAGVLSRTILSNIRVLAVDQEVTDPKDKAVVIGKTVTLELTSAQTHLIAQGQAAGALSLALRSIADNDEKTIEQAETSQSIHILRGGRSEIINVQ